MELFINATAFYFGHIINKQLYILKCRRYQTRDATDKLLLLNLFESWNSESTRISTIPMALPE